MVLSRSAADSPYEKLYMAESGETAFPLHTFLLPPSKMKGEMYLAKRKLEKLHLLDNFLFGSMVSHPQVGEEFIKLLLKIIFGREFGKMTVVPQKFYYGADTDKHGARLDVYLEETPIDGSGYTATVYDMEPDKNNKTDAVAALPRRVRFYHAKIDENAVNDDLKCLNDMVNIVKHDKEVSLNYMKTMEWEEMLINQGLEQGRSQEQANTERERLRADSETQRADSETRRADLEAQRADSEAARAERAEKELVLLKKQLASLKSSS